MALDTPTALGAPARIKEPTWDDIWKDTPSPPPQNSPGISQPLGSARVAWVGAHGGAGTSTLCTVTGLGNDYGRTWPRVGRGPVILVARTHASGLASARNVIADHRFDPPFALVLVADSARRRPRVLEQEIKQLARTVPHLRHVGWIEDWRTRPRQMTPNARQALVELTDAPQWAAK